MVYFRREVIILGPAINAAAALSKPSQSLVQVYYSVVLGDVSDEGCAEAKASHIGPNATNKVTSKVADYLKAVLSYRNR